MPEKKNGVLKKNGHSYRLHGEEKSSARHRPQSAMAREGGVNL
jgi:hypothetical protein